MVQTLPHCSSGCSTRRHRDSSDVDSSDVHVAAARRSVLLLPLFACSPHAWVSITKKSIFSQDFRPISDRFWMRFFQNSIRTPLVFDKESP